MIGLFLGNNNLPLEILRSLKKKKINFFILDLTKEKKFKNLKKAFSVNIGQFGKIINLIKSNKCNKVIFAGNIVKPRISSLKLDLKGFYYLPRIVKASKLGDAAILKELIKILQENKIKVLKLNKFNPELTLTSGNYTKIKPNKLDLIEIKKGINFLNKSNSYNHTQAAVIRNNKIISYEKRSGTQSMLMNIKKTKNKKGFLIKLPKKKQDLRVDLPTIGFDTVKKCNQIGLKGIILKNKQNIILDKKKIIQYSNKNKMTLHII